VAVGKRTTMLSPVAVLTVTSPFVGLTAVTWPLSVSGRAVAGLAAGAALRWAAVSAFAVFKPSSFGTTTISFLIPRTPATRLAMRSASALCSGVCTVPVRRTMPNCVPTPVENRLRARSVVSLVFTCVEMTLSSHC
jgi:hypothetical protein